MYDDYNDPNGSYYVSDTMKTHWNPLCDLVTDSNSMYVIDLADLIVLCEDNPQAWLWTACWKQSQYETYGTYNMMMSGGGEQMLMSASLYLAQPLQAESIETVYEPTPAEEAENITQILDFLDIVLKEDKPENEKGILDMKAVLEDWLAEISFAKDWGRWTKDWKHLTFQGEKYIITLN